MTIQPITDYETGLEDFDQSDAVVPRLTIVHKEGQFKDSLSGEQFSDLNIIILGLVKQRVLWHHQLDDGDWPMCRSVDHEFGIPNVSEDQPKEKRFPWDKSKFNEGDFTENQYGNIKLPCSSCELKEWKSHPDGKKPYCTEQFTLPILYDPREDDNWVPAIFTVQKTSLKPLKTYLTTFARSKNAAYMAVTKIGLDMAKKGSTDYSILNLKRVGDTDESNWRDYSVSFRQMKEFLITEPGSQVEEVDVADVAPVPSDNVAKPPANVVKEEVVEAEIEPDEPKAAEPKAAEEPVEAEIVPDKAPEAEPAATDASTPVEDDDDLPF